MRETGETGDRASGPRRSLKLAIPLLVFAALAAVLLARLGGGDPARIPSALIGAPAPQRRCRRWRG